jgi:uncharacterized protein (TIGR01777 family)
MHICITWATWFLGTALTKQLLGLGHSITIITRSSDKAQKVHNNSVKYLEWNHLSTKTLEWIEIMIHLAGTSISLFPWNKKNKARIYNSRIESTKHLVQHMPDTCHTFICGSAIWYYPSHPDYTYTATYINTTPTSFMEKLCIEWEKQTLKAQNSWRRVINLRTWLVLWKEKIWRLFHIQTKFLWWIILWSGEQRMSTITLDERVANVIVCIKNQYITWPVNMVSEHIRYKDYIHRLAKNLHRPVRLRIPKKILHLVLGEQSILMLWSWKVTPFNSTSEKQF